MSAPGGEERREVDRVCAELRDVVEMLLHAAEIASEELGRRLAPASHRQRVPVATNRPLRCVGGDSARREPVREDLVDDGFEVPVRTSAKREHKVVAVRNVMRDDAEAVHPGVPDVAAREEPAVVDRRVRNGERRQPPGVGFRFLVEPRANDERLAVLDVAQRDSVHRGRARHAQAHDCLVAEVGGALNDVRVGAVVVRLGERRGDPDQIRHAHPFTAPRVRPPTMNFCNDIIRITTGIAASSTPAANGPHHCAYWPLMKL